ncbi:ankyrin repeat domain-containing protein [Campylobacter jejuni]|uniref:ankyrin repeat domain-containing protein n=2 Tax=Campylobacter jejuni TaxID=197 RepID=UPI001282F965|nr:ankyrin repeat domain-containing protein [Campylobacter jejuni]EIU8171694.1 ankyrin repeat domain-containing protein [Campylobacter coli]EAH6541928.1 ankyrin repeat domain-containing protein [Campylobacter jejuni]EAI3434310.1 ankyrin repeat domain-containing protein [Campylobacter jejuni]EAI4661036.1 ankyrin repeat domain-containing protein [Campylobacter jejuni]EAI9504540.1 ankyrin repeat domain-containing protein [Campylobacter jejuni]
MKTLEDIKAMSYQEKDELEDLVLEIIDNNDLVKLKDILKDYPVKISCYELHFKNKDNEYPLFEPMNLILRAAFACEDNNNDFSILDYLFDEYGLSLKDPKYNFVLIDMKHIKEANEKYILIKKAKESNIICRNALIYYYILNADNPNSQIIKYLVNRGAKFEVHDEGAYGWTPMHFWARRNNYQLLELAIKGGANVDMQTLLDPKSEYNETLLFEAVEEAETYRVTQLLIELGANVNFATPRTPLDDAKGSRNKKLLKDAGAMTSEQIRKKFNLPAYDSSHCEIDGKTDFDLLGKYHDEYSKLLNDAIKKAKESE